MLHTLIKSPFKIDTFSLFRSLKASDDFLALQDGVLITSIGNIFLEDIVLSSANLYVLQED
ncbi:sulfurtransferase TusB, partial [Buchnera aphidicola]|nr:sulfurtransferase TusB [Buchnera aphidicola]